MDLIKQYVGNKTIINIEQYQTKDIFDKISNLSYNSDDILICSHSNLDNDTKYYFDLAFTIPNTNSTITVFYKGDYFYFDKDNFSKIAFTQFIDKASYDIYTECNICSNYVTNETVCNSCGKNICNTCYNKIDKCPYCRKNK